jgi:NitT/TauT family transport system ATP-binding protein
MYQSHSQTIFCLKKSFIMTAQQPGKPVLTISNLKVSFPIFRKERLRVIGGLNFKLYPREFVSVLGPSGCGKTTLLRVIAGLIKSDSGEVTFSTDSPPETRRIGLVFQQANLMPWRTVYENVNLPLELSDVAQNGVADRVKDMIQLVGLKGFEHTYPRDLSGGMAQRVAIARALVQDPDLLLLDEPFGSLDALTREQMGNELLRIWQVRRKTVLMVTHSISEAVYLSDRVIILTQRPAKICLEMKIDLPRPRTEIMRYQPHFGELARQLRQAIIEDIV